MQICKARLLCSHLKKRGGSGNAFEAISVHSCSGLLLFGWEGHGTAESTNSSGAFGKTGIGGAPVLRETVQPLQSLQNEGKEHPAVQTAPFVHGVSTPRAGQAVCPQSPIPGCLWGLQPLGPSGTTQGALPTCKPKYALSLFLLGSPLPMGCSFPGWELWDGALMGDTELGTHPHHGVRLYLSLEFSPEFLREEEPNQGGILLSSASQMPKQKGLYGSCCSSCHSEMSK